MEIFVFASGSKGNMTYLKTGSVKLFVDVGISYKKIKEKMTMNHGDLNDIQAILITHEHSDHTQGLKLFLKNHPVKDVYLTQGTYDGLAEDVKSQLTTYHIIQADDEFIVHGLKVNSFLLSHDANEPVGFLVTNNEKKVVFISDTGYVDETYFELLSGADCYLLEANHHPASLMKSPRPFLLKKRIMGERGHLSNEDAAWLVNHFVKEKRSVWIVTHISEDCNTILDIEEAIVNLFDDPTKIDVHYATADGLPRIKI